MMIRILSKVVNFIKSHGLQAPEGNYTKDGAYDLHQVNLSTQSEPPIIYRPQIYKAKIPEGSTIEDSVLCPKY